MGNYVWMTLALVIGGAIHGAAVARAFYRAGARVAVVDRRRETTAEVRI